jgi:cephalosporin-C deacetylase-like acetyl esterase
MADTTFELVEFESEGATLRGRLYLPKSGVSPHPAVAMAHGLSATITMAIDAYAEVFADHGIAALVYDHCGLGRSDGEPRQQMNLWMQARGYRDAITYLDTHDEIDPSRIGIWGDSGSGREVIVVGAIDSRVAAVVTQCPVCGPIIPALEPTKSLFDGLAETLSEGDIAGTEKTTAAPTPVVSLDQINTPSRLEPPSAFKWFLEYGGRHGSNWRNEISHVMPETSVPFSPQLAAAHLKTPILFMVAPKDEMHAANPEVARATYELVPGPKEYAEIEKGHFGLLYTNTDTFRRASQIQAAFLTKFLSE